MHFFHETKDKNHNAVIAIFFDTKVGGNSDNEFIKSLFQPKGNDTIAEADEWVPIGVHLEELLLNLDSRKIFHYEGSLTTPPCTENVEWNIINDP